MVHLLSGSAVWKTESEFVSNTGAIAIATSETSIVVHEGEIINNSWALFGETKRTNNYSIKAISATELNFQSLNPELGIQRGKFHIDRNIVYSKFAIENTNLNGFEIIRREDNLCYANGALYDNDQLINTWNAVLTKQ